MCANKMTLFQIPTKNCKEIKRLNYILDVNKGVEGRRRGVIGSFYPSALLTGKQQKRPKSAAKVVEEESAVNLPEWVTPITRQEVISHFANPLLKRESLSCSFLSPIITARCLIPSYETTSGSQLNIASSLSTQGCLEINKQGDNRNRSSLLDSIEGERNGQIDYLSSDSDLSQFSYISEDEVSLNSQELEEEAARLTQKILFELGEQNSPNKEFDLYGKIRRILKKKHELTFSDLKRIFGVEEYYASCKNYPCFNLICQHVKIY